MLCGTIYQGRAPGQWEPAQLFVSHALCGEHRPCLEGEHDVVQACPANVPFSAMPPWLHLPVAGVCRVVGAQFGGLMGPVVGEKPPPRRAQAPHGAQGAILCQAWGWAELPAQSHKRSCPTKTTPSPPAEGIIKDCW